MKDVRIPGVVWIIAIVAITGLAHHYLEDPFIVDLVVIVAGMILKSLNLGTKELEQALEIIDLFKRQPKVVVPPAPPSTPGGGPQMRGPMPKATTIEGDLVGVEGDTLIKEPDVLPATPPPPNKAVRWLVG